MILYERDLPTPNAHDNRGHEDALITNGAQIIHRLARWSGLRASRAGEISFPAIARALAADPKLADTYGMSLQSIRASDGEPGRGAFPIASAQPGEGKTTVATHLAVVGRLARRKVIFVDGDLRRPSIMQGVAAGAPGLRELLAGDAIVGDVLDRYDESRHGMSVFPYQRYDIHRHKLRHP